MAKDKVKEKSSGSSHRKNTVSNSTVNVNSRFSCLKNDKSEKNNTEKMERKETVKNRDYKDKDYKKDKSRKGYDGGVGERKSYKTEEEVTVESKVIVEEKVVVEVEEDIPIAVESNVKTLNYLTVAKKVVPSKEVKNKDVGHNDGNNVSESGSGNECSSSLKDTRRGIGLKIGNKVYSLEEYEKIMEEQKKLDDKNSMKRKMGELVKKWESDRKKYIELYGYDNYETVFKFKNYDYHYFDKLDHQYRINNYYTVDDDSNYSEDEY